MYRTAIALLNRFPYNFTQRVIHVLINYMDNGPTKTRHGYLIDFKRTGRLATSLRKAIISGSYEQDYLKMFRNLVNPSDYVVDVGAHEGYISLLLWQIVGGRGGEGLCSRTQPGESCFLKKQYRSELRYNHRGD